MQIITISSDNFNVLGFFALTIGLTTNFDENNLGENFSIGDFKIGRAHV